MIQIEAKIKDYAAAAEALAGAKDACEEEIRAVKRKRLPLLRRLADTLHSARDALAAAIEASPEQFVKPRTITLHGVRVGFVKFKGRIEWDDEAAVIARVRKLLPADQAELLIRVKESVHKPGVYDLTAGDLKRLGIRIEGDGDEVVIKDALSDLDRLIEAWLKDAEEIEA